MSAANDIRASNRRPRRGVVRRPDGREEGVINCRIPLGIATDVRVYCAEKGKTQRDVVAEALRRFLDAEDEREGMAKAG